MLCQWFSGQERVLLILDILDVTNALAGPVMQMAMGGAMGGDAQPTQAY